MRPWAAILLLLSISVVSVAEPVNLKEFFPFGMWLHGRYLSSPGVDHPTIAGDLEALGLNFVCTIANTEVPPASDDPTAVASILKLAEQHNLKLLLSLHGLVTHWARGVSVDELLKTGAMQERLEPFVEEGRKYSSLLGWHIGDEPSGEKALNRAEAIRKTLAELDPDHPGWTETGWSVLKRDVVPHIKILQQDVFQPEVYPLWNRPYRCGIGDFRFAGFKPPAHQKDQDDWITVDLVDQYRELRPLLQGRHVWPWIQSFHAFYDPPNWDWRAPTPEELRCITWISLAEGCKGLCWFGYNHMRVFGDWVELSPEIKSLVEQVKPLTDILLRTSVVDNIAQIRGGGSRYYDNGLVETLRDPDGVLYVAVVNRNCESNGHEMVKVQIRPQDVDGSGTLLAIDPVDNSVIATHRGTPFFAFSLNLRPGEGRLVRLVRAGSAVPLTIEPASKTVKVGESMDFTASGGVGPHYRWSVTNPQVASIDAVTGRLVGLAPGRCVMRVRDMAGILVVTQDIGVTE